MEASVCADCGVELTEQSATYAGDQDCWSWGSESHYTIPIYCCTDCAAKYDEEDEETA